MGDEGAAVVVRVQLLTLLAGPDGVFPPGSVVEVSAEMAEGLIAGGYAVVLGSQERAPAEIETTQAPEAPERAVTERGRRRRSP